MISNIDSTSYELLEPIAVTPYNIIRYEKSNKRNSYNYDNLEIPIDKIKTEPNEVENVDQSLSNNEMVKIYPQINVKPLKLEDLNEYNCDNNNNTIFEQELNQPIVPKTIQEGKHHNKKHRSKLNNSGEKYRKKFNNKILKRKLKDKNQYMTDQENVIYKNTSNATQRTTRNSTVSPKSEESITEKGLKIVSKSDNDMIENRNSSEEPINYMLDINNSLDIISKEIQCKYSGCTNISNSISQMHIHLKTAHNISIIDESLEKLFHDITWNNISVLENYNNYRIKSLLQQIDEHIDERKILEQRLRNLGEMQINDNNNLILQKKVVVDYFAAEWTDLELYKSYCLYKLSKNFYRYTKHHFASLPDNYTINEFIKKLPITINGLLKNMLFILKCNAELLENLDRITILQISEIKIQSKYQYYKDIDCIIKPHKFITIVIAKGLNSSWNQIVYVNFDVKIDKDILNSIITELYNINYSVVACVCNFNKNYQDFWKQFDCELPFNYFQHPISSDYIYTFYYIDDLLLQLRNQFLHCGFKDVNNEIIISKEPLLNILQLNIPQMIIGKDIIEKYITFVDNNDDDDDDDDYANDNINNNNKSDVVNQLFSKQIVNILKYYRNDNDKITLSTINFFELIISFNDMSSLNSQNLEYQTILLNNIKSEFYKLECNGLTSLEATTPTEFHNLNIVGICMTIESFKMLQHMIKEKYDIIDSLNINNITKDYVEQCLSEMKIKHNLNINKLSPLTILKFLKEIFLNDSIKIICDDSFFLNDRIDNNKLESFYVKLLIKWLFEKYNVNSFISYLDFRQEINKIEVLFQLVQNPTFNVFDSTIQYILDKLNIHDYKMELYDVIKLFLIQRHMLRSEFLN